MYLPTEWDYGPKLHLLLPHYGCVISGIDHQRRDSAYVAIYRHFTVCSFDPGKREDPAKSLTNPRSRPEYCMFPITPLEHVRYHCLATIQAIRFARSPGEKDWERFSYV